MDRKTEKLITDCLKFSISKDETRPNLNGVYFDPKAENAVSTNGYIMTYSRHKYDDALKDRIIDFKDMRVIKREFLKYEAAIPKVFAKSELVNIRKDLVVKQRRVTVKAYYVSGKGFVLSETELEEYEFAINPEFLKPLVGYALVMEYSRPLQPIRFTLVDQDSYYIVMPMKV